MVPLESSKDDERVWLTLHTDKGPYLLCAWYRPPAPGDCTGMANFQEEFDEYEALGLGAVLVGDLNVHNTSWLRHSAKNTPEGTALQKT